jgi:hypothetical protein
MSRPRLRAAVLPSGGAALLAMLALLLAVPSAPAATPLPVGESHGVRVQREHGAIVVVFTKRAARLYRRLAGKRVTVSCTELLEEDAIGLSATGSGSLTFRVPKRRRPIRTGDRTRGIDYCRVWLAARTVRRNGERQRLSRELIVSVPLTQTGAVYLDEQAKAITLFSLLSFAGEEGDRRESNTFPTPAELLQATAEAGGSARWRIVALASPADTPPARAVGYFSDGALHAAAVVVSASGRRLFIEVAPDDVLQTNIAGYLFFGGLE